jgi:hypothetical protein
LKRRLKHHNPTNATQGNVGNDPWNRIKSILVLLITVRVYGDSSGGLTASLSPSLFESTQAANITIPAIKSGKTLSSLLMIYLPDKIESGASIKGERRKKYSKTP